MSDELYQELRLLVEDVRAHAALYQQAGGAVLRPSSPIQAAEPPGREETVGAAAMDEAYENPSGRVSFGGSAPCELVMVLSVATGTEPMHDDAYAGPVGEMLEAMRTHVLKLSREQVCVVRVKYRTPRPKHEDVLACGQAIRNRIAAVSPRAVLCFGVGSARTLLGDTRESREAHGRWLRVGELPMLTTLHPDDLIATPADKREAMTHLQQMRATLGDG